MDKTQLDFWSQFDGLLINVKERRKKKKINAYISPQIDTILKKYCQDNKTNKSEIFRLLIQYFFLSSELLNNKQKRIIALIEPVDYCTEVYSKYPSGIKENPDLIKLIKEVEKLRDIALQ